MASTLQSLIWMDGYGWSIKISGCQYHKHPLRYFYSRVVPSNNPTPSVPSYHLSPHKSTIRRIPAAGGVNDVREISTQIQNSTWVLLRVFTVKSLPIYLHASLSVFTILEPPLYSQQSRRSDTFSGKLLSSSGKICSR